MRLWILGMCLFAFACVPSPTIPEPVPPPESLSGAVGITTIPAVGGIDVHVGPTSCTTDGRGIAYCVPVPVGDYVLTFDNIDPVQYVQDGEVTAHVEAGQNTEVVLTLKRLYHARRGIVRRDGRAVIDDDGSFHPLGITFFWGLYGEKYERDRLLANFQFLSQYHYDYIRVLAEVGWPGEEMDPRWPDYQQQLGQLIDDAYAYGLRTEITILGGGTGADPMAVAAQVVRVINNGRTHKIMAVEAANESFQNGPSLVTMVEMVKMIRLQTSVQLVGLSSPGDTDAMKQAATAAGASLFTIHIDRNEGDYKWRQARQGWDFKDYPQVVDSNEPPGPNSSVGTNDNPLQLAMTRATGILSGGAMYVLHVGDMVAGRIDPAHNRHANLWEVPNIDAILKGVRGIDSLLPDGIENWSKYNNSWAGHPLTTNTFWSDGASEGVNRNYAASRDQQFVIVEDGILRQVTSRATRFNHVEAYDPLTLELKASADLIPGQLWTLPGRDDTMSAYIIKGIYQ